MFLSLALAAASSVFLTTRLRTYLHPFQQEEYNPRRLATWWAEKRAFDRWATLGLLIAAPCAWLQPGAELLTAAVFLGWRTRAEADPAATGKKPLNLTPRACHIWWLASLLALLPLTLIVGSPGRFTVLWLALLIQFCPLLLVMANALLRPWQLWRNRHYLAEAATTLARLNPTIIGITGSFGKTSTKYILGHILGAQAPTLATPGSVNTPLGIAQVVRDQLQPHHQYFVAEMGAYGPGSIARLCRLAPPALSCITAIGHAHYERFKSLETVAQAKFEIAEATRAHGGVCVLNIDGIPAALWQPRVEADPAAYLLVGSDAGHLRPGDVLVESVTETPGGLALTLRHNAVSTRIQTPVFGQAQAGNLAVAFAMALQLGLAKPAIAAAMATVQPAPHRLNVQKQGGQVVIDDSYNANPTGFGTALHTLSLVAGGTRRRVLVTPGMVELGTLHAEAHARIGNLAAQNADVVLAVAPRRMPTFTHAIKVAWGLAGQPPVPTVGGPSWQAPGGQILVECPTLAAARRWMQANGQPTDAILIENDLPDRYEARWVL